jgi:hypothetical protein
MLFSSLQNHLILYAYAALKHAGKLKDILIFIRLKDWQPIFDGGCKNIVAILLGKEKSFVNLYYCE